MEQPTKEPDQPWLLRSRALRNSPAGINALHDAWQKGRGPFVPYWPDAAQRYHRDAATPEQLRAIADARHAWAWKAVLWLSLAGFSVAGFAWIANRLPTFMGGN